VSDPTLAKNYNKLLQSTARATFLKDMYWDVHQTLNIYFYPLPANVDKLGWLDISKAKVNKSDLDPLYATLQGVAHPVTAVKAVIAKLFEPLSLSYQYVSQPSQAHIRISFNPDDGSHSFVGIQNNMIPKNQPTMNFGWLDVGCIFHELCHMLGMVHEHQNPRDSPLKWNVPALQCMMAETQQPPWTAERVNEQIVDAFALDTTNGSNFDPKSIMLYYFPKSYFCKQTGKDVSLTSTGVGTSPNYKLSDTDWLWLTAIYPKMGPRVFPGLDVMGGGGEGGEMSDSSSSTTSSSPSEDPSGVAPSFVARTTFGLKKYWLVVLFLAVLSIWFMHKVLFKKDKDSK